MLAFDDERTHLPIVICEFVMEDGAKTRKSRQSEDITTQDINLITVSV